MLEILRPSLAPKHRANLSAAADREAARTANPAPKMLENAEIYSPGRYPARSLQATGYWLQAPA